jgi:hypothetical protein
MGAAETTHTAETVHSRYPSTPEQLTRRPSVSTPNDPVVTYARRSSIIQPSRQGSTYGSPLAPTHFPAFAECVEHPGGLGPGSVVFPSQGYVVPARSRTGSIAGGEYTRKLLRTLSTVSIHESAEGLAGGLAGIAPIGKFIVENKTEEADGPTSEMPREFGLDETVEEDNLGRYAGSQRKEGAFQV